MSQPTYSIERDDKHFGPFTASQLKALANKGEVRPPDVILQTGTRKSSIASKVPGLLKEVESSAKEKQTENAEVPSSPSRGRRKTIAFLSVVLLILVAAVSCGFIWMTNQAERKRAIAERRAAIPEVREFGSIEDDGIEFELASWDFREVPSTRPETIILDDFVAKVSPYLKQCAVLVMNIPFHAPRLASTFTDESLEHLQVVDSLEILDIRNSAITDDGVALVARLPNLKMVDLSETKISDAGLAHLIGHGSLELVLVTQTEVSREAVESLQATNGNTKVWADWNHPSNDTFSTFRFGYQIDTRRRKVTLKFSESGSD